MTVPEPSQPRQEEPDRRPRLLRQVPTIALPGATGFASGVVAHVMLGERGWSLLDVVFGVAGVLVVGVSAAVAREIGETVRTWIRENNETKRAAQPYRVEQTLARTLEREVQDFGKAQTRRFWRLPLGDGRRPTEFPDLGMVMLVARNPPLDSRGPSESVQNVGDGSGNSHNVAKAATPAESEGGTSAGSHLTALSPRGQQSRPGGSRPRAKPAQQGLKEDGSVPSA